ncbi:MAG: ester cyclase [Candidatus Palauibacterales bacterium]|nr:ester cyclase [Candidatus Palauibacterales bacterium]MDP2585017.1 ester cyclase [Candidatus Palauibacterales bacterium]
MVRKQATVNPARFLVPLIALALVSACARGSGRDTASRKNLAVARGYVEAMNRGDASYLDDYFGPGYVYHGVMGELDADGFEAMHAMVLADFQHMRITADDMIASGNEVVTRWTTHGKQEGPFQGIAPTGKEETIHGIIISRFEDGKVVEAWEQLDFLGMWRQLGVAEPAGGGGTPD